MDDVTVARALHILAVVVWIGGVSMVTTVLLPMVPGLESSDRTRIFEAIERRFSRQARLSVMLAGLTGFYMLIRLDAWGRFASLSYWWMHAMVLVWLIFAGILFVAEPLSLSRRFGARVPARPGDALRLMARLHWGLLILSVLTILGAVAGSHGAWFFG